MNKLKSFFIEIALLMTTFAIMVAIALIYRANEKIFVKSYIFQINGLASKRVGPLQNINDISADDLRNKLIKKYISEYFRVIPGEKNVSNRETLKDMSDTSVYKEWQNSEAKTIAKMSDNNVLRMVHVNNEDIVTLNKLADYDYKSGQSLYYTVRYYTTTWNQPNEMDILSKTEKGVINIEVKFEPGIRETINGKKYNLKKYLESGKNPAALFKFKVTNIGDKGLLQ